MSQESRDIIEGIRESAREMKQMLTDRLFWKIFKDVMVSR